MPSSFVFNALAILLYAFQHLNFRLSDMSVRFLHLAGDYGPYFSPRKGRSHFQTGERGLGRLAMGAANL